MDTFYQKKLAEDI